MYVAKIKFLWYKKGEDIRKEDEEHVLGWERDGLVKKVVDSSFADVNKDGIVDEKDVAVVRKFSRKKRKKK